MPGSAAASKRRRDDWSQVRLHVVTGKGGTGKSTVAAALALALATTGRSVLLCEVEGRQGIARMFDVDPLPYAERPIARGLADAAGDSGRVYALHIDPESALLEYLAMYYRLGPAGKALDKVGAVEFATTIAPGVRDVLLTGKVYEAAKEDRRGRDAIRYDAVVLDAPPTGRITQFLGVNQELAGLAKMGPIKSQADTVMTLLRSPATAVHLVTLLEEMPVQETCDGVAELHESGLPVGAVIVNMAQRSDGPLSFPASMKDAEVTAIVADDLAASGIEPNPDLIAELITEGLDHAARAAVEQAQRAVLADLGLPLFELPRFADGVDLGTLHELAAALHQQGLR